MVSHWFPRALFYSLLSLVQETIEKIFYRMSGHLVHWLRGCTDSSIPLHSTFTSGPDSGSASGPASYQCEFWESVSHDPNMLAPTTYLGTPEWVSGSWFRPGVTLAPGCKQWRNDPIDKLSFYLSLPLFPSLSLSNKMKQKNKDEFMNTSTFSYFLILLSVVLYSSMWPYFFLCPSKTSWFCNHESWNTTFSKLFIR